MGENVNGVQVRIPQEMHAAIKAQAAIEERSLAQIVRRAIRDYLAKADAPAVLHPERESDG